MNKQRESDKKLESEIETQNNEKEKRNKTQGNEKRQKQYMITKEGTNKTKKKKQN